MKRSYVILAFILAACLLSACGSVQSPPPSPAVSSNNTPVPPPAAPNPASEEGEFDYTRIDEVNAYLREYNAGSIENADKYKTKQGDTEYYFDTSNIIDMVHIVEFPLYRHKNGETPEYLGTTGFAFQVFGDYTYVQSDMLQEDWPDGTLTRVIDLNSLSITALGRNIDMFIPEQGNEVYYTKDSLCTIYKADASVKHVTELRVEIPDKSAVDDKVGEYYEFDISDLVEMVRVTGAQDGWIYFSYRMFEPEGGVYYEGSYRVKTDGSATEKNGEGKFGD